MRIMYCTTCQIGCRLSVQGAGYSIEVDGYRCEKGDDFAKSEAANPMRILTTTVRTKIPGVPVIPVRTDGYIPKSKILDAMNEINDATVEREMDCGDVLIADVANTGVEVIIASSILMHLGAELENKNELINNVSDSTGLVAASAAPGGGGVNAQNLGVMDEIGAESVGGIVGTAGNAVGVEDGEEESEAQEDESFDRPQGRSHIRRRQR